MATRRFSRRRRRGAWIETQQTGIGSTGFPLQSGATITFTAIPLDHAPLVGVVNSAGLATGKDLRRLQRFTVDRLVGTVDYSIRRAETEATGTWWGHFLEAYAVLQTDDNGVPSDTERWSQLWDQPNGASDLPVLWYHHEQVVYTGTYTVGSYALWSNRDHNPLGAYRDLRVRRRLYSQSNLYLLTSFYAQNAVTGALDTDWDGYCALRLRCHTR